MCASKTIKLFFLNQLLTNIYFRNRLRELTTVCYLGTCPLLEDIYVEGNEELDLFPKRRQSIKNLLPNLKTLDGLPFTPGLYKI